MKIVISPDKLLFVDAYRINGHRVAQVPRKQFYGHPGVYLIRENGVLVYVGMSRTNVYRTLYRHFQQWNDGRGYDRIIYDPEQFNYQVSVIVTSPDDAHPLEMKLIKEHYPRDNKFKYDNYTTWTDDIPVEVEEEEIPF